MPLFSYGSLIEVKVDSAWEGELRFLCGHTAKARVNVRGVGGGFSPLRLANEWAEKNAREAATNDAQEETAIRSDLVACPRCGKTNRAARLRLSGRALVPTFVFTLVSAVAIVAKLMWHVPESQEDAQVVPFVMLTGAAFLGWWAVFYVFGLWRAYRSVRFVEETPAP